MDLSETSLKRIQEALTQSVMVIEISRRSLDIRCVVRSYGYQRDLTVDSYFVYLGREFRTSMAVNRELLSNSPLPIASIASVIYSDISRHIEQVNDRSISIDRDNNQVRVEFDREAWRSIGSVNRHAMLDLRGEIDRDHEAYYTNWQHPDTAAWGSWGERYIFSSDSPANLRYSPFSEEVNQRAEELLKSMLSPEQLDEYEREESFAVVGNITGKEYRLVSKSQINIISLDLNGNKAGTHCIVPDESIPIGDQLLGQKLIIENDEHVFLENKVDWN